VLVGGILIAAGHFSMAVPALAMFYLGLTLIVIGTGFLKGNVSVGDQSVVGRYSILTTMPEGRLRIGRDVLVNSFSKLGASKLVEIGDHAIFASFVEITDASHGYEDPAVLIKHAPFESAPVKIGSNVWLGSGTVVMRGVTIGDGAVVGAKSLVNKDIPANGIAFGVPAQLTRRRGERSTIKSQ
jgi:acetyltransferase-like isoleucine patch superfamily enzyme